MWSKFTSNVFRVAIKVFAYPAQTRKRRCVIWSLIKQRLSIDHGDSSCGQDSDFHEFVVPVLVRIIVHEGHNK